MNVLFALNMHPTVFFIHADTCACVTRVLVMSSRTATCSVRFADSRSAMSSKYLDHEPITHLSMQTDIFEVRIILPCIYHLLHSVVTTDYHKICCYIRCNMTSECVSHFCNFCEISFIVYRREQSLAIWCLSFISCFAVIAWYRLISMWCYCMVSLLCGVKFSWS